MLLAIADMEGRLQGKRLTASHFLAEVLEHGAEGCNYLLAVDVDMETVGGYAMASWERGYGDFVMKPDLDTLRPVPWQEGTVMLLADLQWHDGSRSSPRRGRSCAASSTRLADRGLIANAGTELEFIVFKTPYEDAWTHRLSRPRSGQPLQRRLLAARHARVEPLIRRIRNEMAGAGLIVENSKGECNLGQHEINFRYGEALRTADEHAIYKNGAKEIAAQEDHSITFMAKFNEREGNSCHIHCSLADARTARTPSAPTRQMFDRFVAGQLACMREMTLMFAPYVNSYKRFVEGSFAPTAVAWGHDNRTCSMRVVGHGESLRVENRLPGRRRQPLPGAERDDRRRPARDRHRACRWSPLWRATPTPRRPLGSPPTSTRPATCSPRARWPARPSARRSSTTT